MTIDQMIHLAMAIGTLLIALVGFLAREQLSDTKKAVEEQGKKIDRVHELIAHHGERLASLEARAPNATPHAVSSNGRSRG